MRMSRPTVAEYSQGKQGCGVLPSDWLRSRHLLCKHPEILAKMQVYEREAICNHLRRSCSDPVTRQELPGLNLTPIYLLRSRATDYREQTCAAHSQIDSRLVSQGISVVMQEARPCHGPSSVAAAVLHSRT